MNSKRRLAGILTISILIVCLGVLSISCYPITTEGETATEAAEGAEAAETGTFSSILSSYGTWIWLALLLVAFYFLLIRPQRTRAKKAQDLMSGLQRGDEIVTIGGFYGRIKDIRDEVVIITLASGMDVKISKSAIAKKVTQQ
jgi:preprotein translocase subunit YajC